MNKYAGLHEFQIYFNRHGVITHPCQFNSDSVYNNLIKMAERQEMVSYRNCGSLGSCSFCRYKKTYQKTSNLPKACICCASYCIVLYLKVKCGYFRTYLDPNKNIFIFSMWLLILLMVERVITCSGF